MAVIVIGFRLRLVLETVSLPENRKADSPIIDERDFLSLIDNSPAVIFGQFKFRIMAEIVITVLLGFRANAADPFCAPRKNGRS